METITKYLSLTEVEYGVLQSKIFHKYFKEEDPVTIIDEDNNIYNKKIHSGSPTRIDGLTDWHRKSYTTKGDRISITINDDKKIYLKKEHENNFNFPDEITDKHYFEGAKMPIIVNKYERSKEAREACIKHYGTICSVCSFDFGKIYGEISEGYIHVHHLTELHKIGENYEVDPINDLIPVCPNCHAMLHVKKPSFKIEELKKYVSTGYWTIERINRERFLHSSTLSSDDD